MNAILFDDHARTSLLPLTFTRPVADIRIGILTIREKWEFVLGVEISTQTQEYLRKKYPLYFSTDTDTIWINGSVCPNTKLIEEITIVCIIVILFLFHWRSALSIIIQIPITIAISFILLNAFGLSSNIMSLTGIALAIGVIVDNGIIMSENSYRNLSEWQNNPANKKV